MGPSLLVKRIVIGCLLAACGIASALFYAVMHKTVTSAVPVAEIDIGSVPTQAPASVAVPVRLKIPEIKVDAPMEGVGLTATGAMDVPSNQDGVAWYELGERPGEVGSAVISGHYGWKNNIGSVFDRLHELKPGDKVYSEDDQGVITTFVVRESRIYDLKADTVEIFKSDDGKAHLNLITCAGVWNVDKQMYSNRLVVFTDKE